MFTTLRRLLLLALAAVLLFACGADTLSPTDEPATTTALTTEVLYRGLDGPTQFVLEDDRFIVALINGEENGGDGQVVAIDRATNERTVLLEELDKPTGVAMLDGDLWVMERDRLTRGPVDGERTVVAEDLPNNGRSQGTLTVTPNNTLLFNTSGRKREAVVTDGSGRIFEVDPATNSITEVASGFKHAYAHTFTANTLWSVEMTDGSFDGEPGADELVAVTRGADHGWPHCVGDRRAVAEFDGTDQRCGKTPQSQAVFGPSASPTSVVVSPFADDQLLAALWSKGQIVAVSTNPDSAPQAPAVLLSEVKNPQHMVASSDDGEAVVYLTEFGTGSLLAIRSSEATG